MPVDDIVDIICKWPWPEPLAPMRPRPRDGMPSAHSWGHHDRDRHVDPSRPMERLTALTSNEASRSQLITVEAFSIRPQSAVVINASGQEGKCARPTTVPRGGSKSKTFSASSGEAMAVGACPRNIVAPHAASNDSSRATVTTVCGQGYEGNIQSSWLKLIPQDVVHRDRTAQKITVHARCYVNVLDFGLAKVVAWQRSMTDGELLRLWAALEHASGKRPSQH